MPYIAEVGYETVFNYKVISKVVDFQNNSAGVCKINVKGMNGKISMHHAETIQHKPFRLKDGTPFYKHLHQAAAWDNFTTDGKMTTYQPSMPHSEIRDMP